MCMARDIKKRAKLRKAQEEARRTVYLITQVYSDGPYDDHVFTRYIIYVGDIWITETHSQTFALQDAEAIARVNKMPLVKGRLK